MCPRKKVKLPLREVMDDINRFLNYKELNNPKQMHCIKIFHIWSYSGPHFSHEYEYGHFLRIDGIGELYNESEKTVI